MNGYTYYPVEESVYPNYNEFETFIRNTLSEEKANQYLLMENFHYEFEFIHPFADGNGRMGRMWQTLLLDQWNPMFGWLPIETLIKERQEDYYKVLGECDSEANSRKFIEFSLQAIYDALVEISKTEQVGVQGTEQVEKLLNAIDDDILTTKELMERIGLKHRPTFRNNYLMPAIKLGLIEMTIPDKPNSSKQKYKKAK